MSTLSPLMRLKKVLADPIGCRADSDPIYSVRGPDLAAVLAVVDAAKLAVISNLRSDQRITLGILDEKLKALESPQQ